MSLNSIEQNRFIDSTPDQQDCTITREVSEQEKFQALFDNDGHRSVLFSMVEGFTKTKLPCPREVGELRETQPDIYNSIQANFSNLLHDARVTNPYFDLYYSTMTKELDEDNLEAIRKGVESPHATFAGKEWLSQNSNSPYESFYGSIREGNSMELANSEEILLLSNSDE